MYNAVKNGIGKSGFIDFAMPAAGSELRAEDCRAGLMSRPLRFLAGPVGEAHRLWAPSLEAKQFLLLLLVE